MAHETGSQEAVASFVQQMVENMVRAIETAVVLINFFQAKAQKDKNAQIGRKLGLLCIGILHKQSYKNLFLWQPEKLNGFTSMFILISFRDRQNKSSGQ
ncbi:hypothetical protein V9K67_21725 [Paraflavisolibacter sp. H34]|uniref:hypothetical protein n=1 Tax=Huijunlia imazamoxiresistens TaxID=3127457 RepID=UPI0030162D80